MCDGKEHSIVLLTVSEKEPEEIEVASYGNVASTYIEHPEAKFLNHEGEPCSTVTQGLLQRSHIVMDSPRWIGKETSRHWEQGDDISMVDLHAPNTTMAKWLQTRERGNELLNSEFEKWNAGPEFIAKQSSLSLKAKP